MTSESVLRNVSNASCLAFVVSTTIGFPIPEKSSLLAASVRTPAVVRHGQSSAIRIRIKENCVSKLQWETHDSLVIRKSGQEDVEINI